MIITIDTIQKYRPMAANIKPEAINVYIRESEQLDILPAIGAELYRRYSQLGEIDAGTDTQLQDENGNRIYILDEGELPTEEYKLLNGGFYTDQTGQIRRFEGLKAAHAYLAYARFVRNHSTQVTPFGVVQKMGDNSNTASDRNIAAVSKDAERIGEAHLQDAIAYWKDWHIQHGQKAQKPARRRKRFTAIGD